jgi:SAM-dependent methyltransferase
MTHQLSDRAAREREHYNQGLRRSGYNSVLSHTDYFWKQLRARINAEELKHGHQGHVLEFGSTGWTGLGAYGIIPKELHCINVSEVELKKGEEAALNNRNQPTFHLMDAHDLQFSDAYFDVVFGSSILHHLNFCRALDEIRRVLKPDGKIMFFEPLGINPVSKVVRRLTPRARTPDEQPLGFAELRQLRDRFHCRFHYQQLLSVPAGVVSRVLFREPDNGMMLAIFHMDRAFERVAPPLRPTFRNVVIMGRPRSP